MITNPFEGSIVQISIFEGPVFDLPTEENSSIDTIKQLDDKRDLILSKLGKDKEEFVEWLYNNTQQILTIKLDTLKLLVSCWLASKSSLES